MAKWRRRRAYEEVGSKIGRFSYIFKNNYIKNVAKIKPNLNAERH